MKKKLICIIAVSLAVVALVAVGVTIAWFTDTKETTNVFTAGDVKIRLTEVIPDGTVMDVTDQAIQMDYGHVYPGLKVVKDSIVTNIGSEDAYLAAEIVILDGEKDITSALNIPQDDMNGATRVDEFFQGGLWGGNFTRVTNDSIEPHFVVWENEYCIVRYDTRMTDGLWINLFVKNTLQSGNSLEMWDGFTFPPAWDNDQMLQCTQLRISIKIFAVQAAGFTSCEEAVTSAFGEDFGIHMDAD